MGKQSQRNFRPALLTRLSHIIVVQVLFVFAAIALILFFPKQDTHIHFSTLAQNQLATVEEAARSITTTLDKNGQPTLDDRSRRAMYSRLSGKDNCDYAAVYLYDDHDRPAEAYTFQGDEQDYRPLLDEVDLSWLLNALADESSETTSAGPWLPISLGDGHTIHGCRFATSDGTPGVMVAVMDQPLLLSNRPELHYGLILLFLGSILVSLLTVHLISRRFSDPLRRLEQGFDKTASGELFYLVEVDGDTELNRLAESFNRMSKTLWNSHQAQKRYNRLLKDAYITQAESQVFLATLIDCSPCSVVASSSEGEIVIFNRMAADVFGYENGEALDLTIDKLFASARNIEQSADAGSAAEKSSEVVCRRKDGSMFPAFLVVTQVSTGTDKTPVHLFIFLDISESKNFQEMMVSVDRYYTRGEMAGDIAHEINNYLAVLGGNIELMPLFLKRGDQEKITKKLELMKTTVDKIARFADGLMDVNQGDARFAPADLNQLVQNMLAFLKPQNRFDGIELVTDLSAELPLVELDHNQIQQTLVNLIQNAADALFDSTESKRIRISTQLLRENNSVRVCVVDNGPGVEPEREPALFEKRFTTKRKGHGYGLVTCRRIVDKHSGRIGYERREETTFFFEIPIRHPQVETKPDTSNDIIDAAQTV